MKKPDYIEFFNGAYYFKDTFQGEQRLNIVSHAEVGYAWIDNRAVGAETLVNQMCQDFFKDAIQLYSYVHLIMCDSATGGESSLAAEVSILISKAERERGLVREHIIVQGYIGKTRIPSFIEYNETKKKFSYKRDGNTNVLKSLLSPDYVGNLFFGKEDKPTERDKLYNTLNRFQEKKIHTVDAVYSHKFQVGGLSTKTYSPIKVWFRNGKQIDKQPL
uniref:Uncharacterized protein n=1 Tax=Xenorhabdus hominickii TaxID=351679 RepID=A0A1V0M496_XENHO|nr:hypothetical protein [Xenorhabdus hominickii]